VIAVNAVFFMKHWRAHRRRTALRLPPESLVELKGALLRNGFTAGVALLSVLIVVLTQDTGLNSGMVYFLLGPSHFVCGAYISKQVRRLQKTPA
jgi:hypothetical protein